MADKKADIERFQVVDTIPTAVKKAKGDYAEAVKAALGVESGKALSFTVEGDAKRAGTKVAGLRGWLNRRGVADAFTVARQGNTIYIQYSGERDKEGKPLAEVVAKCS